MKIGGLEKYSLIDYPGKVACCIFVKGCNFRCPFCHNADLVIYENKKPEIDLNFIFSFLRERRSFIDAVVITGGEPTIFNDLPDVITDLKKEGFLVKLDTNGSKSRMIKNLIEKNLLDYIAMDIKAPFEKYNVLSGVEVDINEIKKSIELIKYSGISYEFRTTYAKPLLDDSDLKKIKEYIGEDAVFKINDFVMSEKVISPEMFT